MFRSFSFFALIIENNPMDMGMGGWRERFQLKLKNLCKMLGRDVKV